MQKRKEKYVQPHAILEIVELQYNHKELNENEQLNILYCPKVARKNEETYPQLRSDHKWQIHKFDNSYIWLIELDNMYRMLMTKCLEKTDINVWCLDHNNFIMDRTMLNRFIVVKSNDKE